ncbi:unnamed protein product [Phytophthora fragariaefolia]|uniref:Unnamed protein product n=1 Tax=Phytophthora fragariaefolia TaxID=1490495 RepID=A0A9W6XUX2_9STRA|nr:unnamed protein product [Phytophthora fragariaefolia]
MRVMLLDPAKIRKQRGRAASKKDSVKQESNKPEPNQPGMLRIMTPKSAAAATATSDSAPVLTANGATPSIETGSERGSEKRAPKGGKKNGGRGRNNPKKGKDAGDGADGEGASKTDAKPHPRRKGGNNGKKEPNTKGERVRY